MNKLHYPSLELCKKLTEIEFPETEHIYAYCRWTEEDANQVRKEEAEEWKFYNQVAICPSVMEMLDLIPWKIEINDIEYIFTTYKDILVSYESLTCHVIKNIPFISSTFPNALAEIIIWLHNNWVKPNRI